MVSPAVTDSADALEPVAEDFLTFLAVEKGRAGNTLKGRFR